MAHPFFMVIVPRPGKQGCSGCPFLKPYPNSLNPKAEFRLFQQPITAFSGTGAARDPLCAYPIRDCQLAQQVSDSLMARLEVIEDVLQITPPDPDSKDSTT